ncbi:hypothetical protein BaRGS_00040417 [Batillaria attramentaria]|uniref:Uncharacterized protein n=1 Tax=Batillaria attramentaria TaxID=370345 RepID=A0ABD0J0Q5_9CAEN
MNLNAESIGAAAERLYHKYNVRLLGVKCGLAFLMQGSDEHTQEDKSAEIRSTLAEILLKKTTVSEHGTESIVISQVQQEEQQQELQDTAVKSWQSDNMFSGGKHTKDDTSTAPANTDLPRPIDQENAMGKVRVADDPRMNAFCAQQGLFRRRRH